MINKINIKNIKIEELNTILNDINDKLDEFEIKINDYIKLSY